MTDRQSTIAKVWTRVRVGSPEECWPVLKPQRWRGYGAIYLDAGDGARHWRTHRLVHFLFTGEKPPVVMHTCDNPPCCNPAHLLGGTQAENIADCVRKGRKFVKTPSPGRCSERTHCKRGHALTDDNVYIRRHAKYSDVKDCKRCRADARRAYEARIRGAQR